MIELARRLAVMIWLTTLVVVSGIIIWLGAWHGAFPDQTPYFAWLESIVISPVFSTVGVVIALRRPAHRIGWLFLAIGTLA